MSSLQLLAESENFSDILRGPKSLGAMLEDKKLDAVPSPDNSRPGNELYISSGSSYTIQTYKGHADVVEMYIPCQQYADDTSPDGVSKGFVNKMADAILNFYNMHYGKTSNIFILQP